MSDSWMTDEEIRKRVEVMFYIKAARGLLDEFKTAGNIPWDRLKVSGFTPEKLRQYCILIERNLKEAH